MTSHSVRRKVLGPWSLTTCREFWEGFAPASLSDQTVGSELRTVFRVETDWSRATTRVTQAGETARIEVSGQGDLEAAAEQVARFLSLDVDARRWPDVGKRDAVIADAQGQLPGLRPCGFHSPYEAAIWAVLSQRIRITQAAKLRETLIRDRGDHGAVPAPKELAGLDLDLPGRKTEYLRAVAEAALDGQLDSVTLRSLDPVHAIENVQQIKGLGPFGAELVVLRGANAPDVLRSHDQRLNAEIVERYGPGHDVEEIAQQWRPFRTWATVYLRARHERRAASS